MSKTKTTAPSAAFKNALKDSGIPYSAAKGYGIQLFQAKSAPQIGPELLPAAGYLLRYHDLDGKRNGFWRYRYLDPPLGAPRYAQPAGVTPRAYFDAQVDWPRLLEDKDAPLLITEGEKKAISGNRAGYLTVALGGVWNFQSTWSAQSLIPDLESLDWQGRLVFVAYDSDAKDNPQVALAEERLAARLTVRGAIVSFIRMPSYRGKKQGLDDFLVREGDEALMPLMENAEDYARNIPTDVVRLNDEVAFLRDQGAYVIFNTGKLTSRDKLIHDHFAPRRVQIQRPSGATVDVPAAQLWSRWAGRCELGNVVFQPGQDRITEKGDWNLWEGWGAKPARGDVKPWRELLDYLFDKDKAKIEWFERWCAYPIQHPGAKLYSAVYLWGPTQRTGKTLVGYSLGKIYGRHFHELGAAEFTAAYNGWHSRTAFALVDEMPGEHRRQTAEKLKKLVTQKTVAVNEKYVPGYDITDACNWIFTSNQPDALALDTGDKRFFIHCVRARRPMDSSFYAAYHRWLWEGDGADALMHRLTTLDLGDWNPRGHALTTKDKTAATELSFSEIDDWCNRLREDPDQVLLMSADRDLWTADQLLVFFQEAASEVGAARVTALGMARALVRSNVPIYVTADGTERIKTVKGMQRLFVVRNWDETWSMAREKTARKEFDRHVSGSVDTRGITTGLVNNPVVPPEKRKYNKRRSRATTGDA